MQAGTDHVISVLVVALPVLVAEGGRWLRHRQRVRAAQVEELCAQVAALTERVEALEQHRRWAP